MPAGGMKRLLIESSSSSGRQEAEPAVAVLCPQPRRLHPCSSDLILGAPNFLFESNSKRKEAKKKQAQMGDEEGGGDDWVLFAGSPPARADNPLVHDPHFLLNQRNPLPDSPSSLAIFHHDHLYSGRPSYSSSGGGGGGGGGRRSFGKSLAPAVRIQGFDVACRGSHNGAGGRVLSARA